MLALLVHGYIILPVRRCWLIMDPWSDSDKKTSGSKNYSYDDIKNMFNNAKGGGGFNFSAPSANPKLFLVLPFIIFFIWMVSGFYIINPEEVGVETVLGKYKDETRPGLNYNFPTPIGKVYKVKTTRINREILGMKDYNSKDSQKTMQNEEFLILTGDENILDLSFETQWRVSAPKDYLFNVSDKNRELTVKKATESAMREILGKNSISFLLEGEGRFAISEEVKTLIQSILDSYNMGVEIISVQLKKVDPPSKVIDSFRDVQSARADREREINQAYSYKNDIVPKARGEASVIVQGAEAYKQEQINKAKGESSRFISVMEEYKKSKDVTKRRIYLDNMEKVLMSVDKVLVDKDLERSVLPFLHIKDNNLEVRGKK